MISFETFRLGHGGRQRHQSQKGNRQEIQHSSVVFFACKEKIKSWRNDRSITLYQYFMRKADARFWCIAALEDPPNAIPIYLGSRDMRILIDIVVIGPHSDNWRCSRRKKRVRIWSLHCVTMVLASHQQLPTGRVLQYCNENHFSYCSLSLVVKQNMAPRCLRSVCLTF